MKKIISVLLTFIMTACLFASLGSAVSAETTDEPSSTDAAYLINYNNSSNNKGYGISKNCDSNASGKAITISFDYYLKNAENNVLYVGNVASGGDTFADNTTGSEYLLKGKNSFSFTVDSYAKASLYVSIKNGSSAVTNAQLYIWNIVITLGGTDIFVPNESNQYGNDGSATMEALTYEDVLNAQQAYHFIFSESPKDQSYVVTRDLWNVVDGVNQSIAKPVEVSFKYRLNNASNNEIYVANAGVGGGYNDNTTGTPYLLNGEHTFTYTAESESAKCFCVAFKVEGRAVSNADLYIWDVVMTVEGKDYFTTNPSYQTNKLGTISVNTVDYEDIVNGKDTYLIEFNNTPANKGYTVAYNDSGKSNGATIKISFDYILADAESNTIFVRNGANGANYGNLLKGKHTFNCTVDSYNKPSITVTPTAVSDNTNAKLYIWNLSVTLGGTEIADPTNTSLWGTHETTSITTVPYVVSMNECDVYSLDYTSDAGTSKYYAIANKESTNFYNTNTSLNISFKYYLTNAEDGELIIDDWASSGDSYYSDSATKTNKFYAGSHSFNFTTENFTHNSRGCIAPRIKKADNNVASNAVLYIWDLKIVLTTADGTVTDWTWSSATGSATKTAVTYSEVPNKGDSNNDGLVDARDIVRAKKYFAGNNVVVNRANMNTVIDAKVDATDLVGIRSILLDNGVSTTEDYSAKNIICWGDSLTIGMGMKAYEDYPAYLQNLVGEGYKVLNAGSSGETSAEIAARQGAYKVYVSEDIVFDADVKKVLIGDKNDNGFELEDGTPLSLNSQNEAFTNDLSAKTVYINDVAYTLSIATNSETGINEFFLSRSSATEALTIPAETEVVFASAINQQGSYCEIFYVGANDGLKEDADSKAAIVQRYNDMAERHGDDCYLVVTPHWSYALSAVVEEAFGDKAVNLMSGEDITRVMNKLNLEITETDATYIEKDQLPPSLTYQNGEGELHLNEYGYYYMATLIYERGVELGYWN